ncbi:hypothetical protein [Cecembia sp.]|uniref:hypothetical protein n=1 Tax=Cecembia sp. TaxID=1898110 RepID=UPI0025C01F25|nr:hypothetical protein [Cecembia sp.]
MKTNKIIQLSVFVLLLFSLEACSKKYSFPVSSVTPSADGEVKVKKQKGGIYSFETVVKNLANPSRLTPPKAHYIVWVQNEEGEYQNLGELELSRRNNAKLEGALTYKPVYFIVTAEDVKNANWPNLQQTIFKSERLRLR